MEAKAGQTAAADLLIEVQAVCAHGCDLLTRGPAKVRASSANTAPVVCANAGHCDTDLARLALAVGCVSRSPKAATQRSRGAPALHPSGLVTRSADPMLASLRSTPPPPDRATTPHRRDQGTGTRAPG